VLCEYGPIVGEAFPIANDSSPPMERFRVNRMGNHENPSAVRKSQDSKKQIREGCRGFWPHYKRRGYDADLVYIPFIIQHSLTKAA